MIIYFCQIPFAFSAPTPRPRPPSPARQSAGVRADSGKGRRVASCSVACWLPWLSSLVMTASSSVIMFFYIRVIWHGWLSLGLLWHRAASFDSFRLTLYPMLRIFAPFNNNNKKGFLEFWMSSFWERCIWRHLLLPFFVVDWSHLRCIDLSDPLPIICIKRRVSLDVLQYIDK